MTKKCIVLRGCPGSGKSTYANRIKSKFKNIYGVSVAICSADNYFIKNGTYFYDRTKLSRAHENCQNQARKAALHDMPYILIDNTSIMRSDFAYYIRLAKEFDYQIIEKVFGLDLSPSELFARNCHGVPIEKIKLMSQKLADSIRNVEGQIVKKANKIMTIIIKR